MQRLTETTLPPFVAKPDTTAILFGAPLGEATLDQAHNFAEAWIEHRDSAAFGYVDAFQNVAAARAYKIRVLPTILVLHDGEVVARLEGRQPSLRIGAAINVASAKHRIAA